MPKSLSLYLDLIRGLAALVVLLSHLGHGHLIGGQLWIFTYLGNEAVMAFFVLSGLVIAFMADGREHDLARFSAARLARLYSVILPAMLLTLVLDLIGWLVNPKPYALHESFDSLGSLAAGYLSSLIMIDQSWSLSLYFGSNGAYWSIPYEFWYYMLFGAAFFLRGWKRLVAVGLGALVAGPKILTLLPVWLLGVAVYRLIRRQEGSSPWQLPAFAASATLLAYMLYTDWSTLGKGTVLGAVPGSLAWSYLFGAMIALNVLSFAGAAPVLGGILERFSLPIRALANVTFSLYLFHLPVLGFVEAVSPFDQGSIVHKVLLILAPLAVAFTLGKWCERQKGPIRGWLLVGFTRWLPPGSRLNRGVS